MTKYIALIDCDSFFCSCERKLNPELNNKPICVVSGERGCVISRSKEAKQMGVKMGMPLFKANVEYPDCLYIPANHYNYLNISKQVMSVLKKLSPNVEVYSIDEAFVDITGLNNVYKKNYFELGKFIKQKIQKEANIPVSIGISRSKTLAKLASDRAKSNQNGVILLGKRKSILYLNNVSISEIWGIGRKLTLRCQRFGIRTAAQFVNLDDSFIKFNFGISGLTMKYELLGYYLNPITTIHSMPKSIIDTQSFPEFTTDYNYIKTQLLIHIHSACRRLRANDCKCSKIGVILKTKDFQTNFLSISLNSPMNFENDISKEAIILLEKMYSKKIIYRSVGIILENFKQADNEQLELFNDNKKSQKSNRLAQTIDNLEQKFGRNIVTIGFFDKKIPNKQEFMISPKNI